MDRIGIITYSHPHLKTEQVLLSLLGRRPELYKNLTVYALPFRPRKSREIFFAHRPDQSNAVSPDVLCEAYQIPYVACESDTQIPGECGLYLVTGAGILSEEMVKGKKIINAHPGIIPAARGLDAFKWSIYHEIPLGVTLHYIDEKVDMGKIISVVPTPVFITDSLESLARRHYENEVAALCAVHEHLAHPRNDFTSIAALEATKRMPFEIEVKMARAFDHYKEKYSLPYRALPPRK